MQHFQSVKSVHNVVKEQSVQSEKGVQNVQSEQRLLNA